MSRFEVLENSSESASHLEISSYERLFSILVKSLDLYYNVSLGIRY